MEPNTFDAGPLADVEAHPSGDRWTVVFVRELHHPPAKVWAALTEPDQLAKWAPFDADRDLGRVGDATLTMVAGSEDEESIDMAASVRRAEPPTLLEYTWGDDLLSWRLEPVGAGTRVTLRHTVDGPDLMPKVAAGWHLCLVVAERVLDGEPMPRIVGDDAMNYGWQELNDAYAEPLGVPIGDGANRSTALPSGSSTDA